MPNSPIQNTSKYKPKWNKNIADKIKQLILVLSASLSKPVYTYYEQLALKEWNEKKRDPNGSEMYLFFENQPQKSRSNSGFLFNDLHSPLL